MIGANKLRIGVLVSGSGTNLQSILNSAASQNSRLDVRVVISNKAGVAALARAEQHGVPAVVVSHRDYAQRAMFERELIEQLHRHHVEWVVLAGFMRVLTDVFLSAFTQRVINIHPSLLPAFPGIAAQRQALNAGVKIAGCTVHFVDSGVDTGPIIAQSAVSVHDEDTEHTLTARILTQEHVLYPRVLEAIARGLVVRENGRVRWLDIHKTWA